MLVIIAVLLFLILCAITGTLPILAIALAIIVPIGIIGVICGELESWNNECKEYNRLAEWEGFNPIGNIVLNIERNGKREIIQYRVCQNKNRLRYKQVSPMYQIKQDSDSWTVLNNANVWGEIRKSVVGNKDTSFQITLPIRFLFINFNPIKVNGSYFRELTLEERIARTGKLPHITSVPKGHWPASEDV